jgi:hypothetical protein
LSFARGSSEKGFVAAVTLDSWMFLSSYQDFREELFKAGSISTLVHIGWNCFPDGHTYNRGVAFVFDDSVHKLIGQFVNLSNVDATTDKHRLFFERLSLLQNPESEFDFFAARGEMEGAGAPFLA